MKRTIIAVVLLMAILLCGCSSASDTSEVISDDTSDIVAETEDNTTQQEQVPKKVIEIVDNIFSDKTEYSSGGSSEVLITAPKIVAPDYGETVDALNEIIEMNIDTIKNEYLQDVEVNRNAEGADSSSRMLVYDVYFAEDGLVSILLKTTIYSQSGGHPSYVYKSINYDLSKGTEFTLDSLAQLDTVKSKILEKMEQTPDKYLSTDESMINTDYINRAFLFDSERVYVYFGEYMIAPRLEGFQMFDFTYDEVS